MAVCGGTGHVDVDALLNKVAEMMQENEALKDRLRARRQEEQADDTGRRASFGGLSLPHTVSKASLRATGLKINPRAVTLRDVIAKGGSGSTLYVCEVDGWQCVCKEISLAEMPAEGA